mmetsp:Transcript_12140/g.24749  ORF Transcript_12140/g.24749 Transcript_12140/m.24749 type:complete len:652 (-) Transcript_12140:737-2692(-)
MADTRRRGGRGIGIKTFFAPRNDPGWSGVGHRVRSGVGDDATLPAGELVVPRGSSVSGVGGASERETNTLVKSTSTSSRPPLAQPGWFQFRRPPSSTPIDAFDPARCDDENWDYRVERGEFFRNRYILEKVIGRGTFGQVVRSYDIVTERRVAIKIIKSDRPYFQQSLQEVRMTAMLQRLDPDDNFSIIRMVDKFVHKGHQCLVFELLSFSLYDYLRSTDFMGVNVKLVRKFALQILQCLEFLARPQNNIIHCDLKPENVLLRDESRSTIRVIDFGSSCKVTDTMLTYVQSRFYRAPEVILGLPYDTQIDVWSLGCMLVELFTGYPVFAGRDEGDQIGLIVERLGLPPKEMLEAAPKAGKFFTKVDGSWNLIAGISSRSIEPGSHSITVFVDELVGVNAGTRSRVSTSTDSDIEAFLDLVHEMLLYDPRRRIDASRALQHPFFTGAAVKSGSGRDSPTPIEMGKASVQAQEDMRASGRDAPLPKLADNEPSAQLPEASPSASEENLEPEAIRELETGPLNHWTDELGIEPPPWRDPVGRHLDLPERPPSIGGHVAEILYLKRNLENHYRHNAIAACTKRPLEMFARSLDAPVSVHFRYKIPGLPNLNLRAPVRTPSLEAASVICKGRGHGLGLPRLRLGPAPSRLAPLSCR